jgi:hypothetical protein
MMPSIDWAARQRGNGARVPVMKPPREDSLVVVIKVLQTPGTARGVSVWYHDRSRRYHWRPLRAGPSAGGF